MPSLGDTMLASYPSRHSHHYSNGMGIDMELIGGDDYSRYPSLSPSPSNSPARESVNRQRSSSIPSISWSGELEHHPPEPKPARKAQDYCNGGSRRVQYSRESSLINPDIIDYLDNVGAIQYHHEGPYDAVYAERNHDSKNSPLEALKESNEEALKATPKEKIADCLDSHRPLDGVAFYPPGTTDNNGRTYEYEEGFNMMTDYGNFVRFPGLKFTDEDFKNDPFYNAPILHPFEVFRKMLSSRRNRNRKLKRTS